MLKIHLFGTFFENVILFDTVFGVWVDLTSGRARGHLTLCAIFGLLGDFTHDHHPRVQVFHQAPSSRISLQLRRWLISFSFNFRRARAPWSAPINSANKPPFVIKSTAVFATGVWIDPNKRIWGFLGRSWSVKCDETLYPRYGSPQIVCG